MKKTPHAHINVAKEYDIKVTEEQASFIESYTMVTDLEREVYYIPYWFEKKGNQIYKVHSLDSLPESIIKIIKSYRNET